MMKIVKMKLVREKMIIDNEKTIYSALTDKAKIIKESL